MHLLKNFSEVAVATQNRACVAQQPSWYTLKRSFIYTHFSREDAHNSCQVILLHCLPDMQKPTRRITGTWEIQQAYKHMSELWTVVSDFKQHFAQQGKAYKILLICDIFKCMHWKKQPENAAARSQIKAKISNISGQCWCEQSRNNHFTTKQLKNSSLITVGKQSMR